MGIEELGYNACSLSARVRDRIPQRNETIMVAGSPVLLPLCFVAALTWLMVTVMMPKIPKPMPSTAQRRLEYRQSGFCEAFGRRRYIKAGAT
mmetsp:Transcript_13593/g.47966  ORF Transcript_13593/g.47966 Transcript_13593/m.47966 type:complete len:92 (+) Transcript_13593:114-389(+)